MATRLVSRSRGSASKASKSPTAVKTPTVQAVESFEVSENPRNPELLAHELVDDLEADLEQRREISNHFAVSE